MKHNILLSLCFLLFAAGVSAQTGPALPRGSRLDESLQQARESGRTEEDAVDSLSRRAVLAMTTPDYPVTPGDIYTLTYRQSYTAVSVPVMVESDYVVNLNVFGKTDARGLSFTQLRKKVEAIVRRAYPDSQPQIVIQSVGTFQVMVKGEVTYAGLTDAWGLSRLSSVISGRATAYASTREVAVLSSGGRLQSYDLFRAGRYGELEQNPYIRPGDTVILKKYDRKVTVRGEVRRPGSYQLREGEELSELIEVYADGFTVTADPSRLQLTRYATAADDVPAKTMYLDTAAYEAGFSLRDHDELTVRARTSLLPVIYFEGAIGSGISEGVGLDAAGKIPYRISPGEQLSSIVKRLEGSFSAVSDLKSAYIIRVGAADPIPVDLEELLYVPQSGNDVMVQPNDKIVVPFRQYFVTVSGAVMNPGRYPYVPDRSWKYYVNLAGGFDTDRNSGEKISITDMNDVQKSKARLIQPEDKIEAKTNDGVYYFSKIAGILSTVISITALVLNLTSN